MSESSNTKTILLTIIVIVLFGILGIMFYQMNQDTPAEEAAQSISEAADDIGDAVQDTMN